MSCSPALSGAYCAIIFYHHFILFDRRAARTQGGGACGVRQKGGRDGHEGRPKLGASSDIGCAAWTLQPTERQEERLEWGMAMAGGAGGVRANGECIASAPVWLGRLGWEGLEE